MKIALQRCDRFVARTMNWMYDHLLTVPRFRPLVLADELQNREEFPALDVMAWSREQLPQRVWRRLRGPSLYPPDRARLRRLRPSVLHSHFGYVAVGDHGLQEALEVPWIVGFYGADAFELPRDPAWIERYHQLFERVSRVLVLGPFMAGELEKLGCPPDLIRVHPLGVDTEGIPMRPRELAPGEPLRILFAGTFREKKGIPYLLEALGELKQEGVAFTLDLVGDAAGKPGDEETKRQVLGMVDQLDLADRVRRHPFLPFAELLDLALTRHVLVAPSVTASDGDSEGTPFIIQQLMASGMPVVSTRHSDIPFLFGSMASRLAPERDAPALAAELRRYATDPESLLEDGKALRRQVEVNLDARRRGEALAAIYDEVS